LQALDNFFTKTCGSTKHDASNRRLRLKTLDLSHQFTSENSFAARERLEIELLVAHPSHGKAFDYFFLRKLILSANQIQDSDMVHVAAIILRFPNLQELDLGFNDVTTEGLKHLVRHSQRQFDGGHGVKTSRIRKIRLVNNPLSIEASKSFLDLFKIFPMLRCIDSNVQYQKTTEADEIEHMIDINAAGRVLLQRHPCTYSLTKKSSQEKKTEEFRIALSVWPVVIARLTPRFKNVKYCCDKCIPRSAANGLYYLIRHGPVLAESSETETSRKVTKKKTTSSSLSSTGSDDTNKQHKADPALGGFNSLDEFLSREAPGVR
jgi:hypothetical protein